MCLPQSSARCDRPVPWLGVCPGEKAVMGHPTTHQMSNLNPTETHWCERMQDMSGYVLPDLTSQPLDEQLHFTYSTSKILTKTINIIRFKIFINLYNVTWHSFEPSFSVNNCNVLIVGWKCLLSDLSSVVCGHWNF